MSDDLRRKSDRDIGELVGEFRAFYGRYEYEQKERKDWRDKIDGQIRELSDSIVTLNEFVASLKWPARAVLAILAAFGTYGTVTALRFVERLWRNNQ
jgi:hypothetical protein